MSADYNIVALMAKCFLIALLCLSEAFLANSGNADEIKIPGSYATTGADGKFIEKQYFITIPVQTSGKEVQVKLPPISLDNGGFSSQALNIALSRYPKASVFYLTWETGNGFANYDCTVVYNRSRQNLKYICSGGSHDDAESYTEYRRGLMTGVTPNMIAQISAPSYVGNADGGEFIQLTKKYGAKMQFYGDITDHYFDGHHTQTRYRYPLPGHGHHKPNAVNKPASKSDRRSGEISPSRCIRRAFPRTCT